MTKLSLTVFPPGTLTGLTPVDASVIIADGEDGKTIGVQLSKEAGNSIVLKTDGLFAAGTQTPEFAIEKQGEATEGYAATYRLRELWEMKPHMLATQSTSQKIWLCKVVQSKQY